MTAEQRVDAVTANWTAIVLKPAGDVESPTLADLTIGGGLMADVRSSLARAVREAEAAVKERCAEAGTQAVWDADEREDKAISKGSAEYSRAFRTANTAACVGEAIRALE